MLEKLIQVALESSSSSFAKHKGNISGMVIDLAKKYWKILSFIFFGILLVGILLLWLLWSVLSWIMQQGDLAQSGTTMFQKVEEVGLNWVMEAPLQVLQSIWYGKDGK